MAKASSKSVYKKYILFEVNYANDSHDRFRPYSNMTEINNYFSYWA